MPGIDYDELLQKADIVSVVSQYIKLTKQGRNYKGLCPFHNDRSPSLTVSPEKGIFMCWVCNIGGNSIKFVQLCENLSYSDAMYKLADEYGVKYDKRSDDSKYEEKKKLREDIKSINKEAAKYFYYQMTQSDDAKNYLKGRGLNGETVKKFQIGYSPEAWDAFYGTFHKMGISDSLMLCAGLISQKERENGNVHYYDRFRGRIMFPICDVNNNVLGFSGRVMDKDAKTAKYINTEDTVLYTKGEHLFGLNLAKNSKMGKAIVVEGQMDCIALHSHGIDFAVASLGTALTEKQAALLKKYFPEVILAYDNDEAGLKATKRGMEILKSIGVAVKIFRLTGAKDPDEYLQSHTKEEFMNQLNSAYSMFEFKLLIASENFPATDNESIIKFINEAKKLLAALPDTDREIYTKYTLDKYAASYGLTKDMIRTGAKFVPDNNEVSSESKFRRINVPKDVYGDKLDEVTRKIDYVEKSFIIVLADNPEIINRYAGISTSIFSLKENVNLFNDLLEMHKNGTLSGVQSLYNGTSRDNNIAIAMIEYSVNHATAKASADELLKNLKLAEIDRKVNDINNKMKDINISSDDKRRLLKEYSDLQLKKKNLKII